MFKLRDYQFDFMQDVLQAWTTYRSVLGVMPTGAGKTATFSQLVLDHKGASCVIAHRREIVAQISIALGRMGVYHRVVAPGPTIAMIRRKHLKAFGKSFVDPQAQCAVASVQTLTSKSAMANAHLKMFIDRVTMTVFDEGHHYVEQGIWAKAVHMFERAKVLFVTATPERADGVGLGVGEGGFAEVMVEGPTPRQLIDWGFLCRYEYKCPETDFDVGGVAVGKNGDFNAMAMRARVVDSDLVGDMVQHYLDFASGTQAIVFVSDIATANETAAEFNRRGVNAVALSSKSDDSERERGLQEFENGTIKALINVDLFDEGFDVPAATTCIMGRATMSLAKYMQMVGRVLRTAEGKAKAIIIDPVRNWERHGQVIWDRVWSLAGKDKSDRESSGTVAQRVCLSCSSPYEAFYLKCPYCGAVPEPAERERPEHVDGNLVELDLEALDALFEAKRHANMSDSEFERDQLGRRVPPIGRAPELRRFRATKYRRGVLRHLIGWWIGHQQGRELAEIHKRFYLRFGVDVITAETLNLKDTDELIEKIAKRFDCDLVA